MNETNYALGRAIVLMRIEAQIQEWRRDKDRLGVVADQAAAAAVEQAGRDLAQLLDERIQTMREEAAGDRPFRASGAG